MIYYILEGNFHVLFVIFSSIIMFRHFNKGVILGVDVGGSHISSALVGAGDGLVLEDTFCKDSVDPQMNSSQIFRRWAATMKASLSKLRGQELAGIGIAMPGPFDYVGGTSLIDGVNKYRQLYGINVREALKDQLGIGEDLPVFFENDAFCFGVGESCTGKAAAAGKIIALTLGTGLGSAFVMDNRLCREGEGVPPGGYLYSVPFLDGMAEDYISARWLIRTYCERSGLALPDVREIARRAQTERDPAALDLFENFGRYMGALLEIWSRSFGADCLVMGGSISKAAPLFLPAMQGVLSAGGIDIPIYLSEKMEMAAMAGAVALMRGSIREGRDPDRGTQAWRRTLQPLMPMRVPLPAGGPTPAEGMEGYDLYPYHRLGKGRIQPGYDSLAGWIAARKTVLIDGYIGNDWAAIRAHLSAAFRNRGKKVLWYDTSAWLRPEKDILELTKPFMGEPGSVWGRLTTLELKAFFRTDMMEQIRPEEGTYDITILLGIGAALSDWSAPVLYVDLPKNEIQYRMRAGSTGNLGVSTLSAPAEMYKRFYFIDWVVLNRYRQQIKERIAVVADGQWKTDITWSLKEHLAAGLSHIGRNVVRVRPWFEAGIWGGQWLKQHIAALDTGDVNYAWSFELIVPENGVVFESDGNLLEISFDWLMEQEAAAVLGKAAARFGTEFPIRFDFLDTFDGGDLSIQCHPSLAYIQEQFGERITQDETYYILDAAPGAGVYLGFREDIDPAAFREALEYSNREGRALEITDYVQRHPAKKHDLFLIPNGTIHSSGKGNLVLEISATPYIYTFKMYDWMRMDLNGEPRPINIGHAFRNLNFERKGKKVQEELLSRPVMLREDMHCRLVHVPTHPEHFYDVHRVEFDQSVTIETGDQCHVLMLVEGDVVRVETENGDRRLFHFAETFVIPAAAKRYTLINESPVRVKVVKAFIK
jgi:predicted NBD/HSP70 family sugar kinase/mannose-6-phosphate isomerase class I